MSKLSLDELKELAKEQFEANPEVDHVLAFSDGNIFLPTSKSAADMHGRGIKSEAYTISNPDFKTKSEDGTEGDNDDPSLLGDGDSIGEKTEDKEPKKLTKKEQAAADKLANEQAKVEAAQKAQEEADELAEQAKVPATDLENQSTTPNE